MKPPLGVQPKYIWIEHRIMELQRAIVQYAECNLRINPEWVEEYNMLLLEVQSK